MGKACGNIVYKYNSTEHNTAKIEPLDAVKKENHLWVNWHLQNNVEKTGNTLRLMRVIWLELTFKKISLLKVMNRIGVESDIM